MAGAPGRSVPWALMISATVLIANAAPLGRLPRPVPADMVGALRSPRPASLLASLGRGCLGPAATSRPDSRESANDANRGPETPGRHPMTPTEVVEAFGTAWADHDLGAALSMLTEDCVFDSTGPAPDGARHEGIDAIRQAWQPIFDDPTSRFDAAAPLAAGDRVIQLWRYSWGQGHVRGVDVLRVRGGKVAEKLSYVKG